MQTQLVDGLFGDLLQVVRFLRVYWAELDYREGRWALRLARRIEKTELLKKIWTLRVDPLEFGNFIRNAQVTRR